MKRPIKRTLIVLAISVLLTALTVVFCLLGDMPTYNRQFLTAMLGLWAFSVAPSFVHVYDILKTKEFFKSFRLSFWFGYIFGQLIIVGAVLIAPVFMIIYYIDLIFPPKS